MLRKIRGVIHGRRAEMRAAGDTSELRPARETTHDEPVGLPYPTYPKRSAANPLLVAHAQHVVRCGCQHPAVELRDGKPSLVRCPGCAA